MKQFKYFLILTVSVFAASSLKAQVTFSPAPSRIVGQPSLQQSGVLTMVAPNLVEGREFDGPEALAIDTSSSPNILYVADTFNNRILAWKNAPGFTKGDKADKAIGQRDLFSVSPKGPGTDLTTGVALPTAVAVDSSGNLYVADAGNNRVLRYPAPFKQTGDFATPDIVIGQADLTTRAANQGNSTAGAATLYLLNGTSPFRVGLAIDSQGNLWVSDPGNNRVLRFPSGSLSAGSNQPSADLVLGQPDFTTRTVPAGVTATGKNFLAVPSGLAFDPAGRLFVADQANRVLVFVPPFANGQNAARIMGVIPPTAQNPNPPVISEGTLGSTGAPPEGVFFVGSNPFVADTGNARILKYDSFDNWPAEATLFSPKAIAVIGQPDFTSNKSNQGQPQPAANTFSGPVGAHVAFESNGVVAGVFSGTDLYVVDAGNNRVMVFPQQTGSTFPSATRLLGQVDFPYNSINLIEGREFFFQQFGGAVVIDPNSNPPHLYVSDPGNNRVLGFLDYRKVHAGSTADLVIGQPDLYTGIINYPKNQANQLNDQGLYAPEGLAVDGAGNLWVADSGNGRALRFPAPFAQTQGAVPRASLVIGQAGFFQKVTDASSQNMRTPWGVALTVQGHLLVSDIGLNRVLFFRLPTGGDFTNGQAAYNVIGQPDYGPPSEPAGPRVLSSPRLIALDGDDKLYVADSGNNRVVVYFQAPALGIDPQPSFSLTGLNNPFGVVTDRVTEQVWVADTGNNRLLRYPRFNNIGNVGQNPTFDLSIPNVFGPFAVAVDAFNNPVVAEGLTNRVTFFYPLIDNTSSAGGVAGRFSGNAANYFARFAPGMLASIFAFTNTQFGSTTAGATAVPLPTTLGDIQVLAAGSPAPLLYASPAQINFQVPSNLTVGSTVEFQVVKASTGQILATSFYHIEPYAPGLFTSDGSGGLSGYSSQLAALNQDNTVNSAAHPAKAGSVIQLFGTGIGLVSGAPADGTPAPNMPLPSDEKPQVFINGAEVAPSDVTYSGLAPGFIGLWQVNAKVPGNVPTPDIPVSVALVYRGINTRLDANGVARTTTIRTTP